MKVLIDIPEEFATDYTADKFKEFFGRVIADMYTLCGTYEKETADMFIEAFENSKPYNQDKVVEQLEKSIQISESAKAEAIAEMCGASANYYGGAECAYERAIEIVKGGGVDG